MLDNLYNQEKKPKAKNKNNNSLVTPITQLLWAEIKFSLDQQPTNLYFLIRLPSQKFLQVGHTNYPELQVLKRQKAPWATVEINKNIRQLKGEPNPSYRREKMLATLKSGASDSFPVSDHYFQRHKNRNQALSFKICLCLKPSLQAEGQPALLS